MYGLGNIRDERLHRTFLQNGVKWFAVLCLHLYAPYRPRYARLLPGCFRIRPAESKDDWFNLCVVHQNRLGLLGFGV